MLNIKMICVGKMKEPHYIAAVSEYAKRLSAFCTLEICELAEEKLPLNPSPAELASALSREAAEIKRQIPSGAFVVALCIEGKLLSSEDLSELVQNCAGSGSSKICFVIGSSNGLAEEIKSKSAFRLSMSKMTFPHHLARVMLIEQIYRAMTIGEGRKYHK